MHSCLTLTNVGGHWYVEREVSGLLSALRGLCESIHSCDVSVEGPGDEAEEGSWRVELTIRVFDEIVRAATHVPEGSVPQQSLAIALGNVYARAKTQLDRIAEQHGGCCSRSGRDTAPRIEACA